MLADKSSAKGDNKCNKNEKFYNEKLLSGLEGFEYVAKVLKKYFLRLNKNMYNDVPLYQKPASSTNLDTAS